MYSETAPVQSLSAGEVNMPGGHISRAHVHNESEMLPELIMALGDVLVAPDGGTVTLIDVGQRIVFENQHVRVWDLMLEPGERQAWHEHDHPYLVIGLEAASPTAARRATAAESSS
ncbi:hypothetical protein [Actinophytocola sp.]|uniref:hypothetical protein n=1 Tax=Actinophytocola sp. TaxID=1872138 RepID=UPI003D6BF02F